MRLNRFERASAKDEAIGFISAIRRGCFSVEEVRESVGISPALSKAIGEWADELSREDRVLERSNDGVIGPVSRRDLAFRELVLKYIDDWICVNAKPVVVSNILAQRAAVCVHDNPR